MSRNLDEKDSEQISDKIYSYNEGPKNPNNLEYDAFRRSMGGVEESPQKKEIDIDIQQPQPKFSSQTSIVHIDQSPPYIWVLFIVFGIIQIIFIIVFWFYYNWDENLNAPWLKDNDINSKARKEIKNKYRSFQDMTIIILLGFGFLRSSLKHHLWSSITLTFIGAVLSFEFGLLFLITWSSLLQREWIVGLYNFNALFDGLYIAASYVISSGAFIGKLSFSQYFVVMLVESFFASLNYLLVRQSLNVIDIGGTLNVHLFGAVFGSIFSMISFCNKNEMERINTSIHLGSDHNSNLFALFGSLMIIPLWPSFNTALVDVNLKYRGIINTYFSVGGSIIAFFLMSSLLNNRKFKIEDVIHSSFPGAIVVGGCCHLIKQFYLCIFFGIFAAIASSILSFLFYEKVRINNRGYHDTFQILFYHGIPAIIGGIITSIFLGNLQTLKKNIHNFDYKMFIGTLFSDDINNITLENKTNIEGKAAVLFGAIFLTIVIAGLSGLCVGLCVKFCNCNIAWRYFNDSEFFDVDENEPFPWIDERVELKFNYNSKPK